MIQGARKDRKGNPRNEQKEKSLAPGQLGNTGPEGNILQLILEAYSNQQNKTKPKTNQTTTTTKIYSKNPKEMRVRNGNELSDGKKC